MHVRDPQCVQSVRAEAARQPLARPKVLTVDGPHHVALAQPSPIGGAAWGEADDHVPPVDLAADPGRPLLKAHRVHLICSRRPLRSRLLLVLRTKLACTTVGARLEKHVLGSTAHHSTSAALAKELLKDLARVDASRTKWAATTAAAAAAALLESLLAELVVHLPLLWIGQHSVGLGDRLELLLRLLLVVRVLVRMPLQAKLAEGLLELALACAPFHAKDPVVIGARRGRRSTMRLLRSPVGSSALCVRAADD
mmetsp:Transcript_12399/g.25204  ORF Transcript_12399/g.25204 Transcript_12399/m.25204 type:complete len:253 (-) Transcript_12399:97-855(-)